MISNQSCDYHLIIYRSFSWASGCDLPRPSTAPSPPSSVCSTRSSPPPDIVPARHPQKNDQDALPPLPAWVPAREGRACVRSVLGTVIVSQVQGRALPYLCASTEHALGRLASASSPPSIPLRSHTIPVSSNSLSRSGPGTDSPVSRPCIEEVSSIRRDQSPFVAWSC